MGVFRGWSKLVDEAELSETEPVQFRLPLPSRRGDVLARLGVGVPRHFLQALPVPKKGRIWPRQSEG